MVLGLGLVGAEAGHLVAYEARFGTAAGLVESSGAHAYFPVLAKTGVGALAAILLGGLFVLALARVLSNRPLERRSDAPSLIRLLAMVFTLQLAVFAVQETVEAAVAGVPGSSIATLLLWGTFGQLPVAFVTAVTLRWLLTSFDGAVAGIRHALTVASTPPSLVPALAPAAAFVVTESIRPPALPYRRSGRAPPPRAIGLS